MYRCKLNTLVTRQHSGMNFGDITRADDSDFDFVLIRLYPSASTRSVAARASRASSNGSRSQYSGRKISTLATLS